MTIHAQRINRAAKALQYYKSEQLKEVGPIAADDITDFVTDLRHYCDKYEIDLAAGLSSSYRHYIVEKFSNC